MSEQEHVTVWRKDKPDMRFQGAVIASADNRKEATERASFEAKRTGKNVPARWTELAVYELASGNWVACSFACSEKEGETDFGDAQVISKEADASNMIDQAMTFFGWTWLAKELAENAGWNVVQELT